MGLTKDQAVPAPETSARTAITTPPRAVKRGIAGVLQGSPPNSTTFPTHADVTNHISAAIVLAEDLNQYALWAFEGCLLEEPVFRSFQAKPSTKPTRGSPVQKKAKTTTMVTRRVMDLIMTDPTGPVLATLWDDAGHSFATLWQKAMATTANPYQVTFHMHSV